MAAKDLIPFNRMTEEEQKRLARLGGLANKDNPKSKLAAHLRNLKKNGKIEDEGVQRILGIFEDPQMCSYDILKYLDEIKNECKNPNQKVLLANQYLQLSKQIHGEKFKVQSTNTNININIDALKFQELQKKYENEE